MTTPTGSDPTPGSGVFMPEHFAELVLRVLDEEGAESAIALMRRMFSADQGILLERTSGDVRRELLPWLTLEEISDILYEAPTESAVVITRELTAERAADLLDDVDSHTVVDILQELSDQQASAIVEELERPEDVVALPQYPSDSAGGMMTPDFPHVRRDDTAGLALDALRVFGEDAEGFGWVCVLDNDRRLTGYVSIAQLALARPTRMAGELADEYDHRLVSISSETDQEEAHRIMSRYTLSLPPVVDAEQRVLGVIRAEEIMNVAAEEATEDMLRIASAPGDRVFGPVGLSVLHRLPWLIVNLGTVLLAVVVISVFETAISAAAVLAVFCPWWPGREVSRALKPLRWWSGGWR